MRDKTHMNQVERRAIFVRENSISVWKPEQKDLINSQIKMAERFYNRLEKTKNGKEKIKKLRGLK